MSELNLPDLLCCPFCGGAARIESNRDWHKLFCAHDDDCVFVADEHDLMYPAQPGYLKKIAEVWNRRTAPQASESTTSDADKLRRLRDGMDRWGWCAEFGALAMEVLREPSAAVGAGATDKPSARENFANILRIQRAEAETGDPYMIGLYNGMSMMCANLDNATDWDMLPVRAADVATGGAPLGELVEAADAVAFSSFAHPLDASMATHIKRLRDAVWAVKIAPRPASTAQQATQNASENNGLATNESTQQAARQQAATVPGWQRITAPGQVKVGTKLRFNLGDYKYIRTAKLILHPGTDKEEIIYNKRQNYYLITSMAIANRGSQKNCEFLGAAATTDGRDG